MPILSLIIVTILQNIFFDSALALKLEEGESPSFFWYFGNSIINASLILLAVGALNCVKI